MFLSQRGGKAEAGGRKVQPESKASPPLVRVGVVWHRAREKGMKGPLVWWGRASREGRVSGALRMGNIALGGDTGKGTVTEERDRP